MDKFGTGDRVRLVNVDDELEEYESRGTQGTIVEINPGNGDDYRVVWDSDREWGYTYRGSSLVGSMNRYTFEVTVEAENLDEANRYITEMPESIVGIDFVSTTEEA